MAQTYSLSKLMFETAYAKQVKIEDVFRFKPRPYQAEVEERFNNDPENKPLYICWCRRCGKDQFAFYYCMKYCYEHPNSRALYIFPTGKQAKMFILDGVTNENESWITSVVHPSILQRPKSGALYFYDNSIRLKNGSVINFVGDDADTLVGKK